VKRRPKRPRDEEYKRLKHLFGVRPKIEQYCPGVICEDAEDSGEAPGAEEQVERP
jgi:hypothetical protein